MAWRGASKVNVCLQTCDELQESAVSRQKPRAAPPSKPERKFKVKRAGVPLANGVYTQAGIFAKKPQYKSPNGFELFCNFKGLWTISKMGSTYYVHPKPADNPPKNGWSMSTGQNMMTTRGRKPCPIVKEVKEKQKSPDERLPDGPKKMWAMELTPLMNMPNATLGRKLRDVAKDQFVKATHTMGAFYKVKKPQVGYILKEKLSEDAPNDKERDRSISSEPPTGSDAESSEEEPQEEPEDRKKSMSPPSRRARSRSPRRRRSPARGRRKAASRSPSSDDAAKPAVGDSKQRDKMLNMSLDDLQRGEGKGRRSPPRRRKSRSRERRKAPKRRSRSRSRKRRRSRSKKKKRSRSRSRKKSRKKSRS